MLFNSLHFLVFLPLTWAIFHIIPRNARWILLLIASYYFYMSWKVEYILLIIISTLIDYIVSQGLGRANKISVRKLLLFVSIAANLGLLFYFKYYNFFLYNLKTAITFLNYDFGLPYANIILPVGISFYTFQTLSYTLEVYYKRIEPESNLFKFALYVSFFPQLVAGPIERPQNLLPQLNNLKPATYNMLISGSRLILWGLFKKVVIADRLAFFVNTVYNSPDSFHGVSIMLATLFFAFQIYCDFSGYSDIAIGTARLFGVELMKNFRRPYFSLSIQEFWSRWHISLSTWFKDYVYIPLGGNRVKVGRWVMNLFITFVISGIWHGANWTFLAWGAIHGVFISLEAVNRRFKLITWNAPVFVRWFYTFVVVVFGWLFFRANSIGDAGLLLRNMFVFDYGFSEIINLSIKTFYDLYNVIIGIPLILILMLLESIEERNKHMQVLNKHMVLRWSAYAFLLIMIAFFGVFRDQSDFIYFQF